MGGWQRLDDAKAFGLRLLELRGWRDLTLREAAGLAGLSYSFWGQWSAARRWSTAAGHWRRWRVRCGCTRLS
jgi:hypothetical protein